MLWKGCNDDGLLRFLQQTNKPHQIIPICTTAEKKANQIIVVIVIRQKQNRKYSVYIWRKKDRKEMTFGVRGSVHWLHDMRHMYSSVCNDFAQYYNWMSEIALKSFVTALAYVRYLIHKEQHTLSTKWWQIPRAIIIYRIARVEESYCGRWLDSMIVLFVCLDAKKNLFIWDVCNRNVYKFRIVCAQIGARICTGARIHNFAHRNWSHRNTEIVEKWLRAIKCSGKSYMSGHRENFAKHCAKKKRRKFINSK